MWTPTALAIVAVFLASGVLSLALGAYAHRHRENPAATEFRDFAVAGGSLALAELAVLVAPSRAAALGAELVTEALGMLVISAFLVFAFTYTQSSLARRRGVWALYGLTVVYWLVFTVPGVVVAADRTVDTVHGLWLVERQRSVAWSAFSLVLYGLVVAAWGSLLRLLFDSTNVYRKQTAIVLASSVLVTVGVTARVVGLVPGGFPLGVAVRTVEVSAIWFAIFRYDFLAIMPLARDALVDTIDDPVLVLDDDGEVAYANDAAATLTASGVRLGAALDESFDGLRDAIEADSTFQVASGDGVAFDGGTRVFAPRTSPLVDQYDTERGRVVVLHDVTERQRREQRLEEFASVVSHDLRNPLNVADGYVRERYRETGDDHLAEALTSLDRMDEMIGELLTLARDGYDQVSPTALTLSRVAEDAWGTVATGEASLATADADRPIVADEHQLREILENLFRNCLDHNDGSVTVTVEGTERGFAVADDGVGIPASDRESVFDQGFTTASEGTGVGLHVVKRFAEAHGWTVSVTESDAGGARFEFDTGRA